MLFTEKFLLLLYMESTSMSMLFTTVSPVASMLSGLNIIKSKIILSINIVYWLKWGEGCKHLLTTAGYELC